MKYLIEVEGLEVYAYHGVLGHEKAYGQTFLIDCRYQVEASDEDDLAGTVSYAEVADLLAVTATSNSFDLIETLAHHLLAAIKALSNRILAVSVTVHKPQAPLAQKFRNVSVTVQDGKFEN